MKPRNPVYESYGIFDSPVRDANGASRMTDAGLFRSLTSQYAAGASAGEAWYTGGTTGITSTPAAAVINSIRATALFISTKTRTADRIAFNVTTGGAAGSVGRLGLYNSIETSTDIKPSTLLADSGQFDTTATGVMAATISVSLSPGVYWIATLFGVAAPSLQTCDMTGRYPTYGSSASLTSALFTMSTTSFTYAAFPTYFPDGTVANTLKTFGYVRFSS